MLMIVVSSMIFIEIKDSALQMLSAIMKNIWNKWEIRGLVLLSLTLQFILVGFGNRRKFTSSATPWVAILVWIAYLSADWVAAVSLSTLLKSQGEISNAFIAFWAPFLLLHLGGPDTISAYSIEDNDLWLRHFLAFCIQVAVAFYVYWRFQSNSALTILAIPIFVAGIIKYGERIYILRSASSKMVKNSLFSAPKPKDHGLSGQEEHVDLDTDFSRPGIIHKAQEEHVDLDTHFSRKGIIHKAKHLHESYLSLKMLTPLFSNLTLGIYQELSYIFNIGSKSPIEAFKMVETELGFWYDVLYTKRTILNHKMGVILRCICFLSSFSTLVAFSLITDVRHPHSKVDIGITYLLLVGAIFLDIYAAIEHVLSEWTMLWLTNKKKWLPTFVYQAITSRLGSTIGKDQGLVSMAQYNLFHYCLENEASMLDKIERFFDTDNILRKYLYVKWEDVNLDLQNLIYSHLLEKRKRYENKEFDFKFLVQLLAERGDHALERTGKYYEDFRWSIEDVEFNHSLLLWHIATDLCYQNDINKYQGMDILGPCHKMSKSLSDYMLYLLVLRPFMLPSGISEIRYRDTCIDAMTILKKKSESNSIQDLLEFRSDSLMVRMGGTSKSVLYAGARLGQILQKLVTEEMWDIEDKWEIISQVWVEMLSYAASQCGWKEHAQELRRGRELLTHVALLMAHLGLSPKIHIVPLPLELEMLDNKPSWNWDSPDNMAYYLV